MIEIDQINQFIAEFGRYPTKHELNSRPDLPYHNKCLRILGKRDNWYNMGIVPPKVENKTCKSCGNIVNNQRNEFCSKSCSTLFNNLERKTDKCKFCLKKLHYRSGKHFCSRKCQHDSDLWEKVDNWFINDSTDASNAVLRKMLTVLYGYKCSNSYCGIHEWHGNPITLEVDHVNGNHEDSTINNIRLLCPNCHTQTPTYGAKNKGNGRHYRRQRYKDGKSY